jgi:hypothetical protein
VARTWIRLGGAFLAVLLAAGCGGSRDVNDVEKMLVEHYLDPLDSAGITTSVESACRYAGPVAAPWHLSIELRLDAPQQRVADFLKSEGIVVVADRQPMIVQQIPDNPTEGWNGTLAASGDKSILALVYNEATRSDWSGAVGWAEVCPDNR